MKNLNGKTPKKKAVKLHRKVVPAVRLTAKTSAKVVKKTSHHTVRAVKKAHYHAATRPHNYLMQKSPRYSRWHQWKFYKHTHAGILAVYLLVVGIMLFNSMQFAFAADQTDNWDFSTPSNYTIDSGVEASGSVARLKAQNYSSDGNTSALYHLDESSGTSIADSSANNNTATTQNSPTFGTGNLNNGLSLDGSNQYATANDSASLSMTGQQSLESWIKPSTTFNNNSSQSQTVLDKGSYKLGLDRSSGKAFYEIQNNNSEQWTKKLGEDQAGSWPFNHYSIDSVVNYGSDVYVGLGQARGDAEVWKWNGSTWSKVGGDAINSSWADQTYETVASMATNGTALYAGLGNSTGDAEIWTCDLSTNCTSWTKVGGDGNGPGVITHETVSSMAVYGGSLYAGGGTGAGDADVWKYNGGTSWTQVGGDGLNSGWAASTFETVASMYSDGTTLYAGLGSSTTDAEIWSYNGTSWSKIGGDGVNLGGGASWNTNYETVRSITKIGTTLYVGLGDTAGADAEVWKLSGTTWSQVGGDGLNSGWTGRGAVLSLVNDGTNVYAGLGSAAAEGEVWKLTGSTWSRIGGGATNSSTGWSSNNVNSLLYANSKLYAGPGGTSSSFGSGIYEWNGSAWSVDGGWFYNNSWGGYGISRIDSSATYNGKMYFGLGNASNTAQVYEYDGTTAHRIGGSGLNGSWGVWTYNDINAMTAYNGSLYVGMGSGTSLSDVWKWDGTSWTQVGGNGVNSSWNNGERGVYSLTVFNGKLYAGLGNQAYTGDIWEYDGTSWTQVAGEPGNTTAQTKNGSWNTSPREVDTMTVYNNQLCAGLGGSGGWGEVWCWSGSGNWTKIGGASNASFNGSWSSSTDVSTLAVYNGKLYAGVQASPHIVTVWVWDGTSWSQIAGSDVNNTWSDSNYTYARSMAVYNGSLYLGVGYSGSANPTGDVWRYDGANWAQVGGDGINNSWAVSDSREEVSSLTTYKGKLYAGLGFSSNSDALVYSFGNNGYVESNTSSFDTNWHHLAATYDGVNMKLYVDGSIDATQSVAVSGVDNALPLHIGTGYGSNQAGEGQSYFKGQLDEIRISNTARSSFTTKPYTTSPQTIALTSAVHRNGILNWDSFASSESANGGSITYRLSDNGGTTWKYWNGSAWVVSGSTTDANPVATVNSNIGSFPATFNGITWQAVLHGDGTQQVTLNSVNLGLNLDGDAPNTNASSISAKRSNGGASIASGDWTNGSSPYFSWTAGTDTGSGIKGYCLYLGTTSSADPATTKGLLGTSPTDTGSNCQFMVTDTNIDLATSGYLATALTSSNSSYYLNVKAIDNAGNLYGSSEQFSFKFDNTAPTNPGFITAPSSFINTKQTTFTWPTSGTNSPSDANSGIAGLQYKINDSSWYGDAHSGSGDANDLLVNDGTYDTVDPPDFDNINDGVNTIYFRTWDQAGNVTTNYTTAALKVNTSGAPSEPQNVVASPSTNTDNSFAFSWSAPNTYVGSAGTLTYCYSVNVVPSLSSCTFTSAGVTNLPASAFATQPGTNTLYVVARDESNNINYASYGSVQFTANTPAPGIPRNIDVADVSVKSTSNWRLAITWDPPASVGAGIASYKILRSTDNTTFTQVGTSSSTSFIDTNLSQDPYYYKVKACDSANNCGAETSVASQTPTGKFTTPAIITADPQVSNVTTKRATVSWSTDRSSDSKIAIGTKSGSYSPSEVGNSTQVTSHSLQLDNLAAGTTYYLKAKWTDEDGNTGSSQEFSFTTSPAPVLKEITTQATTLSSSVIKFTSKQATKVNIYYGKSDSFGGVKSVNTSLSESTYTFSLDGLDDGVKYYYKLSAFDDEGNEYPGNIFSFTTPPRPKISNLRFQPVTGEPTSTQQITWDTNVPASTQITYGKNGDSGVDITKSELTMTHELVVKNLEDDSEYFLIAQSRDKDGNLSASDKQLFKTALDTRPPVVSDVTVEVSIKGTGAEARGQVVVSWKTDEPSTSQVAYAEGSDAVTFNNKSTVDDKLTTEHLVIVSDLPTSKLFSIKPLSKDKAGNEGAGDVQSAIVGKASDSVLTIILNTLQRIFGF